MEQKFLKTCGYSVLILALAIGIVATATSSTFVLAQPCSAILGSPTVAVQQPYYYNGNFQVTVPISTSCSFFVGQLYATGTAYDTNYNTNLGTTSAVLTPTYSGYGYTGQLTFTFPTSAQSHSVQFSVSVYTSQNGYYYGGPYGSLLAQTASTFVIAPSYYQPYPVYPTYPTSNYPTTNYPTYPSYTLNPSSYYYSRYTQGPGFYYMGGYYNYYRNVNCGPSNGCYHR